MARIAENASAHRVSSELNECIVCHFAALHNKSAVFALERIDIPALKETCRRIPAIS